MSRPAAKIVTGAVVLCVGVLALAACTTVPERSGMLSDYSRQEAFDGRLSKRAAARPEALPQADAPLVFDTVAYAPGAETRSGLEKAGLDLVLNRFARDLCTQLADNFAIAEDMQGSYRLRAFITDIRSTSQIGAALSMPLEFLSPVGGRVPIGMGALSAEVELIGPDGRQIASMVWRRVANVTDSASMSSVSDAYDLAGEAAESFGQVVKGEGSGVGGAVRAVGLIGGGINSGATEAECERYGRGPGAAASLVSMFGPALPPEWTDKGARAGTVEVGDPEAVDDRPNQDQGPLLTQAEPD